jgi:hypothetical protein
MENEIEDAPKQKKKKKPIPNEKQSYFVFDVITSDENKKKKNQIFFPKDFLLFGIY